MSEGKGRPQDELNREPALPVAPLLRAEDLFQGQREIVIEHEGQYYRLRLTRRNKLILQK